ncbi:hypothetical protein Scep_007250 [Stephania cephalantha]|uniref:Nuclease associated modular domain-containing protein n=1 Tax=Stephania cephalantha TaxID=152367 RepID=A0AAP0PKX1_9MAGN
MGWQRRREKLMVQETCLLQWQNLIAEASRRGSSDEEEMQWDSYETLNKQLEREWLDNVEQRKSMSRPKGSKRAPKSVEQRRKISEAISAKWADPGYRERVCFALAKYHGSPTGVKKTPRRRPSGDAQTVKSNTKKSSEDSIISSIDKKNQQRLKLKKSISPTYKDPLADSKLEMIKNIRAQRMAMETKKIEAMRRAKLLIAEAEKAASALEVAALKSPLARASLLETRKLIAEATRSLEVAEVGQNMKFKHMSYEAEVENGESISDRKVNGTCVSSSSKKRVAFDFDQRAMQIQLNESEHKQVSPPPQPANLINGMEDSRQLGADQVGARIKYRRAPFVNRENSRPPPTVNVEASSGTAANKAKKWVCGRLVEVAESD